MTQSNADYTFYVQFVLKNLIILSCSRYNLSTLWGSYYVNGVRNAIAQIWLERLVAHGVIKSARWHTRF